MLQLPNEIVVSILRSLYHIDENWKTHGIKKDLLTTREVCRRLADAAAPLAFRHVSVVQDQEGYRRLRALSKSNYRNWVYSLTYRFEDFSSDVVPKDEFDRYMTPEFEHVSAKREGIYEEYCRGSLYQANLHHFNLDVARLAAAFSLLENLRSIRISQTFTERSGPVTDCDVVPQDCAKFLELPTSCRVLDTIATSLYAADANVKALTLISSPLLVFEYDHWPLTGLIQGLNVSKAALYRGAFNHLASLSVLIPSTNMKGWINFQGLSDFIRSLPALTELVLTAQPYAHADLEFPGVHPSTRLQSIEVTWLTFGSSTLMGFLSQHSESLRRVKMHDVVLSGGSWEDVFSQMRDNFNLRCSDMCGNFYVTGDWNDWDESLEIGYDHVYHRHKQVPPHRSIEDFVEKRTDVGPFELLRAYQRKYPEHDLPDDAAQCDARLCPYYHTPQEAENKLMQERKRMTSNGLVYMLYPDDFHIFGIIICRQGRTKLGRQIMNVAKVPGEDCLSVPRRIRYRDGLDILRRYYGDGVDVVDES